jgi:hypothetical protein
MSVSPTIPPEASRTRLTVAGGTGNLTPRPLGARIRANEAELAQLRETVSAMAGVLVRLTGRSPL